MTNAIEPCFHIIRIEICPGSYHIQCVLGRGMNVIKCVARNKIIPITTSDQSIPNNRRYNHSISKFILHKIVRYFTSIEFCRNRNQTLVGLHNEIGMSGGTSLRHQRILLHKPFCHFES